MSKKSSGIDRSAVFQAILGDLNEAPVTVDNEKQGHDVSGVFEKDQTFRLIDIDAIDYNPNQPRKNYDTDSLEELALSIAKHGVLEPILVRPVGNRFQVVAGERRTRAARVSGLTKIPAQILNLSDEEAFEVSIIENLQREDLNPVEETEAVLQLIALMLRVDSSNAISLLQDVYNRERGRRSTIITNTQLKIITDIFNRLGRFSVSSFVTNRVPILSFPEELKSAVRTGQIEFTKAQLLSRISDSGIREALTEMAIREKLSISQIRRRIADLTKDESISGFTQQGIFTTTEQAPQLLNRVKRQLNIHSISQMDGRKQAEIAKALQHLNHLLTSN